MRLVTRADFDGLVCGALITKFEPIDDYLFVEPKFMQDGQVSIRSGDIIANLPYHPNCTLWFDHHITNIPAWAQHSGLPGSQSATASLSPAIADGKTENPVIMPGKGAFRLAPSAARVVCEYYTETSAPPDPSGAQRLAFLESQRIVDLLKETDKIDAGKLTRQDVLNPGGYVLISMTTDGRYAGDEPYWLRVIDLLREESLDATLKDPEVKRRCQTVLEQQEKLRAILLERASLKRNVIYTDLRGVDDAPEGNRFLIFTLFPEGNIQVKVAYDTQRRNTTAISVGYNIFNPTSKINVGELLTRYGGGGHRVVGSCRVPNDQAEQAIKEIVEAVTDRP
jgi:hypothetical protein